jgi:hypothetical protein
VIFGGFLVDQVVLGAVGYVRSLPRKPGITTGFFKKRLAQGIPVVGEKGNIAVADSEVEIRVPGMLHRFDVEAQLLQCFHRNRLGLYAVY